MKKILILLFAFISSFTYTQELDFQELCIACAEANGFYCGDDPANWTQYSPEGCVVNNWLNDGWEDCVDASDETGEDGIPAEPTPVEECAPPPPICDTVFVEIPVIEYEYITEYITEYVYETDTIYEFIEIPLYIFETIIELDTIYQTEYITQVVVDTVIEIETEYITEYITQIVVDTVIEEVEVIVPEYIYVTDTIYAEVLDTMFIDVIEEVEVVVYDTIIETEIEYVEFFVVDTVILYDTIVNTEYIEFFTTDTVIEYCEIIMTEYVDCETGLPCNTGIQETLDKSQGNNVIYNISGQAIRRPENVYIQEGKLKYRIK